MFGTIAFILAAAVLAAAVVWAIGLKRMRYKRGRILNPFNILFAGVTLASLIMFIPIYSQTFTTHSYGAGETVLLAIHNTIRLFVVDGEFSIILDNIGLVKKEFQDIYAMFAAIMFVAAPFMTFGFVLSFFKNIAAYKSFCLNYFSEMYVFSELNEKSIALAKSLRKHGRKRSIVFTDVFDVEDEQSYELIAQAHEIGAILFKKDIAIINFKFHSKRSKLIYFIIGEDDNENVKQTFSLVNRYSECEHMEVYVFTTSVNSELTLGKAATGKVKVRRVNEVQSLISRNLYDNGIEIFNNASATAGEEKEISAVIIGMENYGTEMTKALSWFGQMDGYRLTIHAFGQDDQAEERFAYECPELMSEKHNHDFTTAGEAHYSINIHSGIDIESKKFLDSINEIHPVTYVFIALGDDEANIRLAVKLRTWFLKRGEMPRIDAVVNNTDKKEALEGITNYSGQEYNIHFIGDTDTSYSEEVIFHSDIEKQALERHLKWGKEEEFWRFEYNYRSSVASAIHKKMKDLCEIPGVEKNPNDRTDEERRNLRILEHQRWNAYMRSEGFTYAEKRNNLAKTHHCLVPFDELPLKEQEKDDD